MMYLQKKQEKFIRQLEDKLAQRASQKSMDIRNAYIKNSIISKNIRFPERTINVEYPIKYLIKHPVKFHNVHWDWDNLYDWDKMSTKSIFDFLDLSVENIYSLRGIVSTYFANTPPHINIDLADEVLLDKWFDANIIFRERMLNILENENSNLVPSPPIPNNLHKVVSINKNNLLKKETNIVIPNADKSINEKISSKSRKGKKSISIEKVPISPKDEIVITNTVEETICLDKDVILQKMEIELIKYIFNIFNNMTENDNFSKKLLKISDESFIGTLLHSLLNTDLLYDFYGHIQQSDISLEIEHMNPDLKLRLVSHLNDICSKKGIKLTRERYILTDYELLLDYVSCMINLYWDIEQIQRHLVSKL